MVIFARPKEALGDIIFGGPFVPNPHAGEIVIVRILHGFIKLIIGKSHWPVLKEEIDHTLSHSTFVPVFDGAVAWMPYLSSSKESVTLF